MEADKGVGLEIVKATEDEKKVVKNNKALSKTIKKGGNKKNKKNYPLFMNALNETAKLHSGKLRFSKDSIGILENSILKNVIDPVIAHCCRLLVKKDKRQLTANLVLSSVKTKFGQDICSGFEKVEYSSTKDILN